MKIVYLKNSGIYLLLHALLAILVGLIFVFATENILTLIVKGFGICLLIVSAILIFYGFKFDEDKRLNIKYLTLIQGVLFVALGIFLLANSVLMLNLIILFFGIWAILGGSSQIFYGIAFRDKVKSNKILIINGLVLIIIGLIMAFKQQIFLNILGDIIGWICILSGIITLYFSIKFFKYTNETLSKVEID